MGGAPFALYFFLLFFGECVNKFLFFFERFGPKPDKVFREFQNLLGVCTLRPIFTFLWPLLKGCKEFDFCAQVGEDFQRFQVPDNLMLCLCSLLSFTLSLLWNFLRKLHFGLLIWLVTTWNLMWSVPRFSYSCSWIAQSGQNSSDQCVLGKQILYWELRSFFLKIRKKKESKFESPCTKGKKKVFKKSSKEAIEVLELCFSVHLPLLFFLFYQRILEFEGQLLNAIGQNNRNEKDDWSEWVT